MYRRIKVQCAAIRPIPVLFLKAKLPSETCRVLFQNKIKLTHCASVWFYYRNISRCTVRQTAKTKGKVETNGELYLDGPQKKRRLETESLR